MSGNNSIATVAPRQSSYGSTITNNCVKTWKFPNVIKFV